jgi:hypothetical protein
VPRCVDEIVVRVDCAGDELFAEIGYGIDGRAAGTR